MSAAEKKYSVCKKEALSVVLALKKFRNYLLGAKQFRIVTDPQPLSYAFKKKDVHGRRTRWLDLFADYQLDIIYRPGAVNSDADYLSRYGKAEKETNQDIKVLSVESSATVGALEPY